MQQNCENLIGKKLLVIGGAFLHLDLVKAAKRMGVETYVTDYLPLACAPAKQIADHAWNLNITEYDALEEHCRREHIDGIVNMYYNPCQRPVQVLCQRLGLPCFGTREQYEIFTDKKRFLETCVRYGVDIIPQYREADFAFDNPAVEYPVYVKPSDSRASRGQSICRSYAEVGPAIALARSESTSGEIIIERFMENARDIQLTLLLIDGELHPECVADKYDGKAEENLAGVCVCGIAPSRYRDTVIADALPGIEHMLQAVGLRNAVVFMQAFVDGDRLRVYDPSLRFPATHYELFIRETVGLDLYEAMVRFALTGRFPDALRGIDTPRSLNGTICLAIFIYIRPGTVSRIIGLEDVRRRKDIIGIECRYGEGDRLENWTYDHRQCIFTLMLRNRDLEEAERTIQDVYKTLYVQDENGNDMIIARFDTAGLRK